MSSSSASGAAPALILDFGRFGGVPVALGDKTSPEEGFASKQEAVAFAQELIKKQAGDAARDAVAGAVIVQEEGESGPRFAVYGAVATGADGKSIPYNLLYLRSETELYVPNAYVDEQGGPDVVSVLTGSLPPKTYASDPKLLDQVVAGAAQSVDESAALSDAARGDDPGGAEQEKEGSGWFLKTLKWAGIGLGGLVGVGLVGLAGKWAIGRIPTAHPAAIGAATLVGATGATIGAQKLFGGEDPLITPKQARIGIAALGGAMVLGGAGVHVWSKAVSHPIYAFPAARTWAAGLGVVGGAVLAGEVVSRIMTDKPEAEKADTKSTDKSTEPTTDAEGAKGAEDTEDAKETTSTEETTPAAEDTKPPAED